VWGSVRYSLGCKFVLREGGSYAVSPSTSSPSFKYATLEEELDEFDAMVE
jgi:hypothetical protein